MRFIFVVLNECIYGLACIYTNPDIGERVIGGYLAEGSVI
jgi:hypothetical protein